MEDLSQVERPKVLIAESENFSPRALAYLKDFSEVSIRDLRGDALDAALSDFDIVWFRLAHRFDRTAILNSKRCKFIATPVTGLSQIDLDACYRKGIRVLSLKGEVDFLKNIRATAELTLALSLTLLRKIPQALTSVKSGRWDRNPFRGRELFESTAGIIGLGRLGQQVAQYFHAFGMKVIAFDTRPLEAPPFVDLKPSMREVLRNADLISLHVDLNSTSEKLLGASEFSSMKPGSVLINTSRGEVIDETALIRALRSNQISGAALDVIAGEPFIKPDHPLLEYARQNDQLILSPHIGGNTFESFEKTEMFLAEKLREACAIRRNS